MPDSYSPFFRYGFNCNEALACCSLGSVVSAKTNERMTICASDQQPLKSTRTAPNAVLRRLPPQLFVRNAARRCQPVLQCPAHPEPREHRARRVPLVPLVCPPLLAPRELRLQRPLAPNKLPSLGFRKKGLDEKRSTGGRALLLYETRRKARTPCAIPAQDVENALEKSSQERALHAGSSMKKDRLLVRNAVRPCLLLPAFLIRKPIVALFFRKDPSSGD